MCVCAYFGGGSVHRSQKRVLGPWELEFQAVVICPKWVLETKRVFYKSGVCFQLLSHITSPCFLTLEIQ